MLVQPFRHSISRATGALVIVLLFLAFFASTAHGSLESYVQDISFSPGPNSVVATATDGDGNIYLCGTIKKNSLTTFGSTNLTGVGSFDAVVAKLDQNFNTLWAKQLACTSSKSCSCQNIAVSNDGSKLYAVLLLFNAVITIEGMQYPAAARQYVPIFLALSGSTGALNWLRYTSSLAQSRGLSTTSDGSVVVFSGYTVGSGNILSQTGTTLQSFTSTQSASCTVAFLFKFTSDGSVSQTVIGNGCGSEGHGVAITPSGDSIFHCGASNRAHTFGSLSLSPGLFCVKFSSSLVAQAQFSSNAAIVSSDTYSGPIIRGVTYSVFDDSMILAGSATVYGLSITTASGSQVTVHAASAPNPQYTGGFLIKLSGSGSVQWIRSIQQSLAGTGSATSLSSQYQNANTNPINGDVYVAAQISGSSANPAVVGDGITYNSDSKNYAAVFKYDYQGNLKYWNAFGSTSGFANGFTASYLTPCTFTLGGMLNGAVNFGAGANAKSLSTGLFLAKYRQCGNCGDGYTGSACQYAICSNVDNSTASVCSGHGLCPSPNNCQCNTGYIGTNCENQVVYCSGIASTDASVCNGVGACNSTDNCTCSNGYTGSNCQYAVCDGVSNATAAVCSGHGTCVNPTVGCICSDTTQYQGSSCQHAVCNGISNSSSSVCNGNGNCYMPGVCSCAQGLYDGSWCQHAICSGVSNSSASSVCNGRGSCPTPNICSCNTGYMGANCEFHTCSGVRNDSSSACSSHGNCTSLDHCDCLTGYTGSNCELYKCFSINASDANVCNGRGSCIDVDNCNCTSGYGGAACELDTCFGIRNDSSSVCSSHGNCTNVNHCSCVPGYSGNECEHHTCFSVRNDAVSTVCSGRGTCAAIDTCQCNATYTGDNCEFHTCSSIRNDSSSVCSGRGSCVSPNTCECAAGYYGSDCEFHLCHSVTNASASVCSSRGQCIDVDNCQCNTGYEGSNCEYHTCFGVRNDSAASVCSNGRGVCSAVDNCTCSTGYAGHRCQFHLCNNIRNDSTSSVCSGHGTCTGIDMCQCSSSNFTGTWCEEFTCFGISNKNASVCNSHGNCTDIDVCTCEPNKYDGFDCRFAVCDGISNSSASICSGHGSCIDPTVGCQCHAGYDGDSCQHSICFGVSNSSSSVCNSRGQCLAFDTCTCDSGNQGQSCEYHTCFGIRNDSTAVCSNGRGLCNALDNCTCSQGYAGDQCRFHLCNGVRNDSTSSVCSGHGICTSIGTCRCSNTNYTGTWCEQHTCFGISNVNTSIVCQGHGNCTGIDTCSCESNMYDGFDCRYAMCFGVSNSSSLVCSGVGSCIDPSVGCRCAGYDGPSCQHAICFGVSNSSSSNTVCNGTGRCIHPDVCECNLGYTGQQCQFATCGGVSNASASVCNGNGQCLYPDQCSCIQGNYTGNLCQYAICFGVSAESSSQVCSNGHGVCSAPNRCDCQQGKWTGPQCQYPICYGYAADGTTNSTICSGHGTCTAPNTCVCSSMEWFGRNCSGRMENTQQQQTQVLHDLDYTNIFSNSTSTNATITTIAVGTSQSVMTVVLLELKELNGYSKAAAGVEQTDTTHLSFPTAFSRAVNQITAAYNDQTKIALFVENVKNVTSTVPAAVTTLANIDETSANRANVLPSGAKLVTISLKALTFNNQYSALLRVDDIKVHGLPQPINFTMVISGDGTMQQLNFTRSMTAKYGPPICSYFDETTNTWSTEGVTTYYVKEGTGMVDGNGTLYHLQCATFHLTSFAPVYAPKTVIVEPVVPTDTVNWATLYYSTITFGIGVICLVIFLVSDVCFGVCCFLAAAKRRKQNQQQDKYNDNTKESSAFYAIDPRAFGDVEEEKSQMNKSVMFFLGSRVLAALSKHMWFSVPTTLLLGLFDRQPLLLKYQRLAIWWTSVASYAAGSVGIIASLRLYWNWQTDVGGGDLLQRDLYTLLAVYWAPVLVTSLVSGKGVHLVLTYLFGRISAPMPITAAEKGKHHKQQPLPLWLRISRALSIDTTVAQPVIHVPLNIVLFVLCGLLITGIYMVIIWIGLRFLVIEAALFIIVTLFALHIDIIILDPLYILFAMFVHVILGRIEHGAIVHQQPAERIYNSAEHQEEEELQDNSVTPNELESPVLPSTNNKATSFSVEEEKTSKPVQ